MSFRARDEEGRFLKQDDTKQAEVEAAIKEARSRAVKRIEDYKDREKEIRQRQINSLNPLMDTVPDGPIFQATINR